jgi:hypothetical protein
VQQVQASKQLVFMSSQSSRFQLQRYGGPKTRHTCPLCGTRNKFTRWLDTEVGELLPEEFGICDRVNNCGYSSSPYSPDASGLSYSQRVRQNEKQGAKLVRQSLTLSKPKKVTLPLCTIPDEVLEQTMKHYHCNTFAQLLQKHFGTSVAADLLRRYEVGTSTYWPGATIFWQRDELGRVRGGQVVLYDETGHTVKRQDSTGHTKRCTTWVHSAYKAHCRKNNKAQPAWLAAYLDPASETPKSPSLYGLAQLAMAPADTAVAIVESTKTAIICTPYLPAFTWLATGGLTYLNAERLRPVKQYALTLYPDTSPAGTAYQSWCEKGEELRHAGFRIRVADVLERQASNAQKEAGFDLADLLLEQWPGYPPSWDES